jgi:hypothetical protein
MTPKHTNTREWLHTGAAIAFVCVALPAVAAAMLFARVLVIGVGAPLVVAGAIAFAATRAAAFRALRDIR